MAEVLLYLLLLIWDLVGQAFDIVWPPQFAMDDLKCAQEKSK